MKCRLSVYPLGSAEMGFIEPNICLQVIVTALVRRLFFTVDSLICFLGLTVRMFTRASFRSQSCQAAKSNLSSFKIATALPLFESLRSRMRVALAVLDAQAAQSL
jgi:hypothetical protein